MTEHDERGRSPAVWDQPEVRARAAVPLDRGRIVTAAMALADEDGLDALSMRKLAAALGASPMSLYRHVARKEDLIELMLDAVIGEHDLAGIPSGDWAADLVSLAQQQRAAALRHPWSVVPVVRPSLGPHAIRHLETSLSVFGGATLPIEWKAWAAGLIETYVRGSVELELADTAALHRTGVDTDQWQESMRPYLQRILATGRFPLTREFLGNGAEIPRDKAFELGLTTLVNGLRQVVDHGPPDG